MFSFRAALAILDAISYNDCAFDLAVLCFSNPRTTALASKFSWGLAV
jgi:hypothetical protein